MTSLIFVLYLQYWVPLRTMLFTCNRIEAHKQESGNTPSKKNLRHIQYGRLSALTGRVGRKNDRWVPIIIAREMRTEKKESSPYMAPRRIKMCPLCLLSSTAVHGQREGWGDVAQQAYFTAPGEANGKSCVLTKERQEIRPLLGIPLFRTFITVLQNYCFILVCLFSWEFKHIETMMWIWFTCCVSMRLSVKENPPS